MDQIIEWYNAGEIVYMTIEMGDIYCSTIFNIDHLVFEEDNINIMSGDLNIYININNCSVTDHIIKYEKDGCYIELGI